MNPGEQNPSSGEQNLSSGEHSQFFRGRGHGFSRGSRPPPPGPPRGRGGAFWPRSNFVAPPPTPQHQTGLMPRPGNFIFNICHRHH